jgi:hypothetical protein
MARTSYTQIKSLPDAAQQWNFDLFFPSIPGSSNTPTNLTYKCKTTGIPESSVETVKIELHGAAKQEAGRVTYTHTFNALFLETIDFSTLNAFRGWRNFMRSWKDNKGTDSSAYKVNLELDLYDNAGNVVNTMILVGAFPTSIGETQLSGSASEAIDITMTFSFDFIQDSTGW